MLGRALFAFTAVALAAAAAAAVDAITGASKREQMAPNAEAAVWINGRGFEAGSTVVISGDGVAERQPPLVVQSEDRSDGGRTDGIAYYFVLDANATPGPRDITVTAPDGRSLTAFNAIEVIGGGQPPPPPPMDAGVQPPPQPGVDAGAPPNNPNDPPPAQPGRVDVVSRASPGYGAQGEQVNLWIVGRSFTPGLTVTFSAPGLGPAEVDGAPLPIEVVRNAESENGQADGIQYYLRIPSEAPVGLVDITVANPDGSRATGAGLFDVLAPGAVPTPRPGDGDVDGITGASPRAMRAGRNVSLWLWGDGFDTGATVSFSNPGIRPYAEPEVVKVSQSHPGFSGIRNFLLVEPTAQPGPITITVTNPNGTTAQADALLTLVDANTPIGDPGGGATGDGGPCPDETTTIESVLRVEPDKLSRGETVALRIVGRAFACGANIVIPGGGLRAIDAPRLERDPLDPFTTTLVWTLEVQADAAPGARDVTVINPNNTSKTLPAAFQITAARDDDDATTSACRATPGRASGGAAGLLLATLLLGLRRRRR